MSKTSINACDMTPLERERAVTGWLAYVERRRELCATAYGNKYSCSDGGGAYLYRMTGFGMEWRDADIIHDVADAYIGGCREFIARCGGSYMRCEMQAFPDLIVCEYLNDDSYGRRPIGSGLRPEECNNVDKSPINGAQ